MAGDIWAKTAFFDDGTSAVGGGTSDFPLPQPLDPLPSLPPMFIPRPPPLPRDPTESLAPEEPQERCRHPVLERGFVRFTYTCRDCPFTISDAFLDRQQVEQSPIDENMDDILRRIDPNRRPRRIDEDGEDDYRFL